MEPPPPMLIRCYRNLTAGPRASKDGPVYSIQVRRPEGWRTVAHAAAVLIDRATLRVSQAGVARVRRTGRKVVCATVEGRLVGWHAGPRGGVRKAVPETGRHGREHLLAYHEALRDCAPMAPHGWHAVTFDPRFHNDFHVNGAPLGSAWGASLGPAGMLALL